MKKYLSLFCCLIMCCFVFVACGEQKPDKYWEHTSEVFNEFLNKEGTTYANGFAFGNSIDTAIFAGYGTYSDLETVYEPLYIISFGFLKEFSGALDVTPANNNPDIKTLFLNFEAKIAEVKNEISFFVETDLKTFVDNVDGSNQSSAESPIALNYLKLFKRKYIDLSSSLLSLSEDFLNLYTKAYRDIPELKIGDDFVELNAVQLENFTNLATMKSIINALKPTIDYVNAFTNGYVHLPGENLFTALNYYKTAINNSENFTPTVKTLYDWQNIYNIYMIDLEYFNVSLQYVNLPDFVTEYNQNAMEYSKNNPLLYAYITKVLTFTENTSNMLLNSVINLLS